MQLDFTLGFNRNKWTCSSESVQFTAETLDELDKSIETHIRNQYKTGEFIVKMFFDFDDFPHWHRQYMPHYFNREIYFSLTN